MLSSNTKRHLENYILDIQRKIKRFCYRYITWRIKFPATIVFLIKNRNISRLVKAYKHHKEFYQKPLHNEYYPLGRPTLKEIFEQMRTPPRA